MTHDTLCPAPQCEQSMASCPECDPAHEPCRCHCDLLTRARQPTITHTRGSLLTLREEAINSSSRTEKQLRALLASGSPLTDREYDAIETLREIDFLLTGSSSDWSS